MSYASNKFRLNRELRFCCEIFVEKLAFLSFRRYLAEIESNYKNVLVSICFVVRACSVVSGSVPLNFTSKFAVVHEVRPSDGSSIFRLAQLVHGDLFDVSNWTHFEQIVGRSFLL